MGPAGLPTMPYDLTLTGSFFDVANFIGGIDGLVKPPTAPASCRRDGRLFTVDGFALHINACRARPAPRTPISRHGLRRTAETRA